MIDCGLTTACSGRASRAADAPPVRRRMATIRVRLDSEDQMKRVTGIGGIFFSAKDPKALCAWYKTHLGIDVQDWGGAAFDWSDADGNPTKGTTA